MKQILLTVSLGLVLLACQHSECLAQAKADLIVQRATITRDATGLFVDAITVTVANSCSAARSNSSYVLVTFKLSDAPGAKAIFYIGNTVKALAGGESQSQTFNVGEKMIGVGRHIVIEADPYQKVDEASEDNNWRTLFPDAGSPGLTGARCGVARKQ